MFMTKKDQIVIALDRTKIMETHNQMDIVKREIIDFAERSGGILDGQQLPFRLDVIPFGARATAPITF